MKKVLMIFLTAMLITTLAGCKPDDEIDEIIYVTVYPMQYLIEEIAGDTVLVKRVPGSTVHSDSIDWSAKEIIDMINADLLFYVNGGVDSYIPDNAESTFADGTVELIDVSMTVTYNQVCYSHEHSHLTPDDEPIVCDENSLSDDPHFWLDPVRMLQAAELVRDKLVVAYPDNSELYENNFTVLSAALEKLNDDFQIMADEATKPIITTVMLFTYWYVRYDIEILALVTSAHSSDTISGLDIAGFIEEAIYHDINNILFEKNTNSPSGDSVLEGLLEENETAMALYLHGLGNLSVEEMENGATYMSIMYDNLETMTIATK